MKAFVTGITGFAGSHLAEHLLASGDEVLGSSRHAGWPPGWSGSLTSIPIERWDLGRPCPEPVHRRLREFRPDWIFHLGAVSVPADCGPTEPTEPAWRINVGGSERVFDLAAALPVAPRVVLVSSCDVYGVVPADDPVVSEQSLVRPTRGYGKTKQAAEQALAARLDRARIDGVVARAFHHTGPRQAPRLMVPEWARQFAAGSNGPVYVHTLNSHLDLTDVRDVVAAYRLLAERGERGGVYNVGSGVSRKSGDVFEMMRSLYDPQREVIELEPGSRRHPIANTGRLRECTGWEPQIPLRQTLRDILDFWRAETDG